MDDARSRLHRRVFGELRLDQLAIAEQQKFAAGVSAQRNCGAGNDNRCADIATHGVKRDSNLLRHERPGNLLSGGLKRSAADLKNRHRWRRSAKRNAAPRPGRDNSVSPPRHNLLTPAFWMPSATNGESEDSKKY